MSKDKKYGLIVPDKTKLQQPVFQASRNVFGNDSDSESETNKRSFLTRPSDISNRQAKISQQKAMLEDPTVYQYDEVYDSLTSKEEKKVKSKEEKKPRYIENLMKAANKRKIENERRVERQIQKERETEGDEFADKEVFVTSAYKKKLQEMRLEEEKEKREEYLESIGDVTKQKDLGGFYRHLYEQKLGKGNNDQQKVPSIEISNEQPNIKNDENKEDCQASSKSETTKKRNYRKRKSSDNGKQLSDGEIEDSDEEINRMNLKDIREAKKSKQLQENIDADSDFIDESSDEDSIKDLNNKQITTLQTSETSIKCDEKKVMINVKVDTTADNPKDNLDKGEVIEPKKPKVDIWKKRTVGDVFEQAVQRYYQRKAARGI